ncbi:hypothetical protein M7I_5322 [Glarea lozoyensis 74030]|uniref:Uncharacterized protein n=1 Tax=Glarea lozoyensis (strain ATCC 74030 / MF5533) TaxID=1104152 RepID=H0ERK3_GLAL7|nr:hypothetical protein M7I_5322 [Glarea lozoyensis 74030]
MDTTIFERFENFLKIVDFTLLNEDPILHDEQSATQEVKHPDNPFGSSTFIIHKLDIQGTSHDRYWHCIQIRERVGTQPASDHDIRATVLVPRGIRTVDDDEWKVFLTDAFKDDTEGQETYGYQLEWDVTTVLNYLGDLEMTGICDHVELYGYAVDLITAGSKVEYTLSKLSNYGEEETAMPDVIAVWEKTEEDFEYVCVQIDDYE